MREESALQPAARRAPSRQGTQPGWILRGAGNVPTSPPPRSSVAAAGHPCQCRTRRVEASLGFLAHNTRRALCVSFSVPPRCWRWRALERQGGWGGVYAPGPLARPAAANGESPGGSPPLTGWGPRHDLGCPAQFRCQPIGQVRCVKTPSRRGAEVTAPGPEPDG